MMNGVRLCDPDLTLKIEELMARTQETFSIRDRTQLVAEAVRRVCSNAFLPMPMGRRRWVRAKGIFLVEFDETERIFHFTLQQATRDYVNGRCRLNSRRCWDVILCHIYGPPIYAHNLWPQSMPQLSNLLPIPLVRMLLCFLGAQEKRPNGGFLD